MSDGTEVYLDQVQAGNLKRRRRGNSILRSGVEILWKQYRMLSCQYRSKRHMRRMFDYVANYFKTSGQQHELEDCRLIL